MIFCDVDYTIVSGLKIIVSEIIFKVMAIMSGGVCAASIYGRSILVRCTWRGGQASKHWEPSRAQFYILAMI
jgi:hypothetical protein